MILRVGVCVEVGIIKWVVCASRHARASSSYRRVG